MNEILKTKKDLIFFIDIKYRGVSSCRYDLSDIRKDGLFRCDLFQTTQGRNTWCNCSFKNEKFFK